MMVMVKRLPDYGVTWERFTKFDSNVTNVLNRLGMKERKRGKE